MHALFGRSSVELLFERLVAVTSGLKRLLVSVACKGVDIEDLARAIQKLIDDGIGEVLPRRLAEFQRRFEQDGDMAYGALNTELFQPVRALLRNRGLRAKPRLPGGFQDSREWGNSDESHQQRWFYSVIIEDGGDVLGAIAIGSHHDHRAFRLPRNPEVLAVAAHTPAAIEREIGQRYPDYAAAQPFRAWWRDHQSVYSVAGDDDASPKGE